MFGIIDLQYLRYAFPVLTKCWPALMWSLNDMVFEEFIYK